MPFEAVLAGAVVVCAALVVASELRKRRAESAAADLRLELALAEAATFAKDEDGRYVRVTEAAAARFGRPVADILGRTDAEVASAVFAATAERNEVEALGVDVVSRDEPSPSGGGSVRTSRAIRRDADGRCIGVVGAFTATRSTASTHADALRARELERLRDLDHVRTQVLNTVTHELRTPLTPIKVHTHLLRASATDERSQRALDVIERNVQRLDDVVKDLLEVAQAEKERPASRAELVEISEVVRAVAADVAGRAEEAGISLETDVEQGLVVVGDARRLRQVVLNLADNALKFTPVGGHVRIEARADGARARVAVADDGEGIDARDLDLLFQPFAQVHDTMQRTRSGAGLGLSVARTAVERHGGVIWAESAGRGRGSTFAFVVPLADAPTVRLVPRETRPALFRRRR